MLDTIIVVGIVAVVVLIAGRSFYRTITDKNEKCNCTADCFCCTLKGLSEMDQGKDVENDGL